MADKKLLKELEEKVYQQRLDLVKLTREKGLHIGGDMSCAEVIVTLFDHVLRIDPKNPGWKDRDRFILSKGHGAGALPLPRRQRVAPLPQGRSHAFLAGVHGLRHACAVGDDECHQLHGRRRRAGGRAHAAVALRAGRFSVWRRRARSHCRVPAHSAQSGGCPLGDSLLGVRRCDGGLPLVQRAPQLDAHGR